jgi:replicative DNA helicase
LSRNGQRLVAGVAVSARKIEVIDTAAFLAADYTIKWRCVGVLADGLNCVIGGRSKTLKTSFAIALAIALATATLFLKRFRCPEVVPVMFLSGESGAATIRETANRIALSMGVALSEAKIFWGFDLPRLFRPEDCAGLEQAIRETGVKVVFIDPLYFSLLDPAQANAASNLFAMGGRLLELSNMFRRLGVTVVLLHHFRKNSNGEDRYGPPEMEELAQSGVAEWARSWLLLARRAKFQEGSGEHELWLSAGGSTGHSSLCCVDVNEGTADAVSGGRKWDIEIRDAAQERERRETAKADASETRANQKRTAHAKQVLDALARFPDGQTKRQLRMQAKLNPDNFGIATEALLLDGRIIECTITSDRRTYEGLRLASPKPANPNTKDQTNDMF